MYLREGIAMVNAVFPSKHFLASHRHLAVTSAAKGRNEDDTYTNSYWFVAIAPEHRCVWANTNE